MTIRTVKGSAIAVRPDKTTTVERDNLKPQKGEIIFNDDIGDNEYWNGSYWVSIGNYIIPTQLTVTEGTTVNLSESTYKNSDMIELSWSGATGTMVLNLPLAASNVNRVIRFISNSGFTASTHADVTPQGGDTLDGSTNKYRINKAYEGIQVWSNGVEWFIIQKKG